MTILLQLVANGVVNGCLFAMLALGFALVYNTTRTFHIAHGAIYTAAGYACYVFQSLLHWPPAFAVAGAVGVAAAFGLLVDWAVYEPLMRRRAALLVAMLSSLGVYVTVVNVIAAGFGNEPKALLGMGYRTFHFGPIAVGSMRLVEVVAAAIVLPAFIVILNSTGWGRTLRAVRDNPALSTALGVDAIIVRRSVFMIGSALAGLAASLSALDVGVDPYGGMPALLIAAVAFIVGGIGTFEGPVVGAFVLGLVQAVAIWLISAKWVDAVTFTVLVLFLVLRPTGLMGRRRRLEEATD